MNLVSMKCFLGMPLLAALDGCLGWFVHCDDELMVIFSCSYFCLTSRGLRSPPLLRSKVPDVQYYILRSQTKQFLLLGSSTFPIEGRDRKMAISLLRETSRLSVQNLLRVKPNEIWVRASFLASRQPQSRNFFRLASQLGKKKKLLNDLKILPTYLRPNNLYRHFSSSLSSSTTGFLKWYLRKLEANPVITKSVSASLIYTSADITSQMITMSSDGSFDVFRMQRICTYALLVTGSCQHYWFGYLSKIMPNKNIFTTLSKILMGQAIYGPCMNTIFFSYNAALRGENGHEILARLKRDLLPTLKNSILYWPFCDFMTFMFVPVHLQPLVTSSLAYLWIIYLSYVASLNKVGSVERKEHAFAKRAGNHAILPSNH